MKNPTKYIFYNTLEEAVNALCCLIEEKKGNSDETFSSWFDVKNPSNIKLNMKALFIEFLKGQNMNSWGFADHESRTVHLWSDLSKIEETIFTFAHELGHLRGKRHKDPFKEERRADEYGLVAKEAYTLLQRLLRQKNIFHVI